MRHFCCFVLVGLTILATGCGGESGPKTVDSSELESFVEENADAIAKQEELNSGREDAEEEE